MKDLACKELVGVVNYEAEKILSVTKYRRY